VSSELDFCLQQLVAGTAVRIIFTGESKGVKRDHVFLQSALLTGFELDSISNILPAFVGDWNGLISDFSDSGSY
jgi:hypothetical protein